MRTYLTDRRRKGSLYMPHGIRSRRAPPKERGKHAWATHPWAGVWYGYIYVMCTWGRGDL